MRNLLWKSSKNAETGLDFPSLFAFLRVYHHDSKKRKRAPSIAFPAKFPLIYAPSMRVGQSLRVVSETQKDC